jgi:hypothetical protein
MLPPDRLAPLKYERAFVFQTIRPNPALVRDLVSCVVSPNPQLVADFGVLPKFVSADEFGGDSAVA